MKAYCFRSGNIIFGSYSVPQTAVLIAEAKAKPLRRAIEQLAGVSYDGKQLLVPGLSEAVSNDVAADVLTKFIARVTVALARSAKAEAPHA